MSKPITAQYSVEPDDVCDILAAYFKQAIGPVGRFISWALLLLFALASFAMLADSVRTFRHDWELLRLSLLVDSVLLGSVWLFIFLIFWNRGLKRWGARRGIAALPPGEGVVEWTVSEDQIGIRTTLSAATLLWPSIRKAVEAPKGFLLSLNTNRVHWIPARAFESAGSLREFAELVRGRIPKYVVLGECRFPAKPDPVGVDEP